MSEETQQPESPAPPLGSDDLLSNALEVCKCAAEMAERLHAIIKANEVALPFLIEKVGPDFIRMRAREAHYWMETLGDYFNGCDAVSEEDEKWDATFEKARKFFPLDDEKPEDAVMRAIQTLPDSAELVPVNGGYAIMDGEARLGAGRTAPEAWISAVRKDNV